MGGSSLEDAVFAARQTKLESDVQDVLEAAIDVVLEELFNVDELYWDIDENDATQAPAHAADHRPNTEI